MATCLLSTALAWLAVMAAGCSIFSGATKSVAKLGLRNDTPTASQSGDAATPASVAKSEILTSIPLPAGSRVEIPPAVAPGEAQIALPATSPGAIVTLSAPSTLTSRATSQSATAPTTHAPPAPPTPAQLATGQGIKLFYWLAVAFGVAAVALFYFGHLKAAIAATAGAAALPLLASFSAYIASHAAVALACVAAAFFCAWYFIRQKFDLAPKPPNPPEP